MQGGDILVLWEFICGRPTGLVRGNSMQQNTEISVRGNWDEMMRDDLFYSKTTTPKMKSLLHIDSFKKGIMSRNGKIKKGQKIVAEVDNYCPLTPYCELTELEQLFKENF